MKIIKTLQTKKTLHLLFKGAKKVLTSDALNNNTIDVIKKDEKMKQLFIGKNGALSHSGYVRSPVSSNKQCVCVCGAGLECRCAYCEAVLCAACQHGCALCCEPHCQRCIILGSEGSEVCVSCYC